MKITDPIMKEFTFDQLAMDAENHLVHVVCTSKNKEDLLLRLALFYTEFSQVLEAKYRKTK